VAKKLNDNMKNNWKIKNKEERGSERLFPDLESIVESILIQRGVDTKKKKEEFLHPSYEKHIHDPLLLSDIEKAVARIIQAKRDKEKICIYGDYDVDGITSATILYDFLQQIGVRAFTYLPDRNKEGYGLNRKAIDYIVEKEADLIITVDCGITSRSETEYAQKQGLDIIITDHHFVPQEIPKALAIINPKKEKDAYPEKMLAGVGVTFKFIQAIAQKIKGYDKEQLKWFLDLVAVGRVADCVPLLGENRTLTKFGLIVLAKTKRVGLKQLFEVGRVKINPAQLPTGEQISFQIAPRINAAGRMDHASAAYKLLICSEKETAEARVLALEIESQNKHRQKVTQETIREVEGRLMTEDLPPAIIESSEHWQLGVVGLVAGKITDKYNRPSIILQDRGETLKGSCRSVPQFHLMEALTKLTDLLEKFGGHSQAAGLTIKKENLKEFKDRFLQLVKMAKISDRKKSVEIDAIVKINKINNKLLDELMLMEPFGQGNEKPKFLSKEVVVQRVVYLGEEKKHLKIWVGEDMDLEENLELILFNYQNNGEIFGSAKKQIPLKADGTLELTPTQKVNVVYTLEENIWNGRRSIQGRIVDLEVVF
jgi:single-stranded-DNA-specific exonuclease